MFDYDGRLERFRASLAEHDLTAAFLVPSADLEYLTGIPRVRNFIDDDQPTDQLQGCFIGTNGEMVVIARAGQWMLECGKELRRQNLLTVALGDSILPVLREAGGVVGVNSRLAVAHDAPFEHVEQLREAFPSMTLVSTFSIVTGMR